MISWSIYVKHAESRLDFDWKRIFQYWWLVLPGSCDRYTNSRCCTILVHKKYREKGTKCIQMHEQVGWKQMWLGDGHKRCTPLKGYRKWHGYFLWVLRPQILPTAGCGVPHFMLAASPSLDVWKMSWKSSAVICLWKVLGWHQKWTASFGLEYSSNKLVRWWS